MSQVTLTIDGALTAEQRTLLAPFLREADVRDKSYQLCPIGEEIAAYLRAKRKVFTPASYRSYEGTLEKLARDFPDLRLEDFEVPIGVQRLEEWLDNRWGGGAPNSYNVHLAHVREFFKFFVRHGRMHSNPGELIERAKKRAPLRTVFSDDQRRAILASAGELRDRIALRLLLDYGLRKGALKAIQFKHFDHQRRRLTIFTKGQTIRTLPLPDPHLWMELERHIIEVEAQPDHHLMCVVKPVPRAGLVRFPDREMSSTALHRYWYRRLEDAGIVAKGVTSGEKLHKARHSAGQRVLERSGNLKLVQRLLGHASIQTTGDVYVDIDELAMTSLLAQALKEDDDE